MFDGNRTEMIILKPLGFTLLDMSYPSWHAVEKIDESVDDVKEMLLPFETGTWLKLALIVLLTGGIMSGFPPLGPSDFDGGDFNSTEMGGDIFQDSDEVDPDISDTKALAILGVIVGFGLGYSYLSSVFRFVFFRTVKNGKPRIRKYFSIHWVDGFKLLIYRTLMILLWLSTLIIPIAGVLTENIGAMIVSVIVTMPIWIAIFLFQFSVQNYAIPNIVENRAGFIESVMKGVSTFKSEWKQAGMFLGVKIALGIAISIISGTLGLIALLALGIPGLIIIIGLFAVNNILGFAGIVLGLLVFMTVSLIINVPFRTYMMQWIYNTYSKF